MDHDDHSKQEEAGESIVEKSCSRREFLKLAGIAGAAIGLGGGLSGLVAACGKTTATATSSSAVGGATTSAVAATTATSVVAAAGSIKIGHIVDLTGPAAMVGAMMKTSLQCAFDDASNQVAGRPVEIIVGDAAGDSSAAVDAARKMVEQDKCVAVFGPNQVGEKMAVGGYIAQAGVPMITYSPTTLALFQGSAANKWVVSCCGSDIQAPTCMADYLYNHLNYRNICTMTMDNSGGQAFLNPLIEGFKALGGQITQSFWVPVPCADFSPYFSTIKPADALVAWDGGTDAIALLTQFHQLGIDKKMPLVGAFHGDFLDAHILQGLAADVAGSLVGCLSIMPYSPDSQDPANLAFVKALTAKLGFPPGDEASAGPYQAAQVFTAAVKATSGDTAPEALLGALTKVNLTGPLGPLSFNSGVNCSTMNQYIVKVTQFAPGQYGYTTAFTYPNVPPTGLVAGK